MMMKTEKFYGRRKGKPISDRKEKLYDEYKNKVFYDIDKSFKDNVGSKGPVWFEVGFGGGEHLIEQAIANPDVKLIGCEPFVNGVAKAIIGIDENNLDNVILFDDDARLIMDKIDNDGVDVAFALFGDPWRKKRHKHRRFIGKDNLERFKRILKKDGILKIATDDPTYLRWIMNEIINKSSFEWICSSSEDWLVRPNDWPLTRYAAKAIKEGRICHFMTFRNIK